MAIHTSMLRRLVAGVGGASLIVAPFLPWASVEGSNRSGWQLCSIPAALCVTVAAFAMITAVTGGRFGLCRPDVSLIGATDLLGVIGMVTLGWLVLVDFPQNASRQPGAILALVAVAVTAFAVADYRPLRGAPLFPRATAGAKL